MGRVHQSCARVATPACGHRDAGDDFFCLRYGVWYASIDCAFRTRFDTSPGCRDCEQGRFNLKRHRGALHGSHPLSRIAD